MRNLNKPPITSTCTRKDIYSLKYKIELILNELIIEEIVLFQLASSMGNTRFFMNLARTKRLMISTIDESI